MRGQCPPCPRTYWHASLGTHPSSAWTLRLPPPAARPHPSACLCPLPSALCSHALCAPRCSHMVAALRVHAGGCTRRGPARAACTRRRCWSAYAWRRRWARPHASMAATASFSQGWMCTSCGTLMHACVLEHVLNAGVLRVALHPHACGWMPLQDDSPIPAGQGCAQQQHSAVWRQVASAYICVRAHPAHLARPCAARPWASRWPKAWWRWRPAARPSSTETSSPPTSLWTAPATHASATLASQGACRGACCGGVHWLGTLVRQCARASCSLAQCRVLICVGVAAFQLRSCLRTCVFKI